MLAESRKRMESDRRRREEIEAAIRAENLLQAAEQLIGEAVQAVPSEAISRAVQAAETGASAVRGALAAGEADQIAASGKALESSLKKLSTEIKAAPVCTGAQGRAA
jgi:molecular chaperone DnaK (HSP70)